MIGKRSQGGASERQDLDITPINGSQLTHLKYQREPTIHGSLANLKVQVKWNTASGTASAARLASTQADRQNFNLKSASASHTFTTINKTQSANTQHTVFQSARMQQLNEQPFRTLPAASASVLLNDFHGASSNLQLKLDIARVSKDIYQTRAVLSKLQIRHNLLVALYEAEFASVKASDTNREIGKIRQNMIEAGVAVQSRSTNNHFILEALARVDVGFAGEGSMNDIP
ncbi:hypothetical protein BJ138DRAFT_1105930 [Hygrophoropsis aurantiaca]|uniref:Uncharacterized protein n=1 Tax=Hygrophoropsis aurantiaca TaxID=72124 RepID=A0ACB7ZXP8_9AGAM|nr:hypothetical protein BJ138DRAFT_1105930 [Hygrophoropsis aurantiaca]